jgi:hypothetical protein
MEPIVEPSDAERRRKSSKTSIFASRNGTGLVRKVAREALKRAVKAGRIACPSRPCTTSATATPAC